MVMIEIKIDAITAVPKPSIAKEGPKSACVIINVIALMTIRNSPNVKIVIGKVKMIKSGFSNTFNIAKMILARIAVPIPSI